GLRSASTAPVPALRFHRHGRPTMKTASTAALWCATALLLSVPPATAQQGDGTDTSTTVHVFKPEKVDATAARMASLQVAEGFTVAPFATGLGNVRILALADDGTVYATRRDEGDVIMLRDADRDGRA